MKKERGEISQYSKAVQETAQGLRVIDDALFRLVAGQAGVCQEILRTLLDVLGLAVVSVTAQSVLKSLHREDIYFANTVVRDGSS